MRAKYRALERRMLELEKVVDRCIVQHGSHLHDSLAASIRSKSMRYAEGMMVLMTAEELSSKALAHAMLRETLIAEIENHTISSIGSVFQTASVFVN